MLNRIFHLKDNNTTVLREFIAGLTTFMAMSYAIFIVPIILSKSGMDYNSAYYATVIASIIGTLLIGLLANVPYAQSAGIGLASIFTYTLCSSMGYTYNEALALVLICGIVNTIVTLSSVRKKLVKAIPSFIQDAITVGIGLFITYIGLINSGIIIFKADSIKNGLALGVTPELGSFASPEVLLALIGLVIIIFLNAKKVKGSYLISIIITTLIGLPLKVTTIPDFSNYHFAPSLNFAAFDFKGLLSAETGIVILLMTVFTLCISDLFDSLGVFIGTGKKSGIFKITKDGNIPKNLERAMVADSLGTICASFLGTSNVTTYLESTAGIEEGGKTGLTSVFTAIFFLLTLLLAPIVSIIPMAAVAPILIIIGSSMINSITNIDFNNLKHAIPAFFIIVMMPLAYSITTGIEFGFITYVLVNLFSSKKDRENISPIIYIFSVLFILKYLFMVF